MAFTKKRNLLQKDDDIVRPPWRHGEHDRNIMSLNFQFSSNKSNKARVAEAVRGSIPIGIVITPRNN